MATGSKIDSAAPELKFELDTGSENKDLSPFFVKFEWESFMNSGYRIYGKFINAYQNAINNTLIEDILKKARTDKMTVKFKCKWTDGNATEERTAIVTHIRTKREGGHKSFVEIEAIDPASWVLNHGKADGDFEEGKVSDVIRKIVEKASGEVGIPIKPTVSETNDNENNIWYRMRLDPKTWMNTLLEWSIQLTKKKTGWVVQSEDDEIIVKDWAELKPYGKMHGQEYTVNTSRGGIERVVYESMDVRSNFLLTVANSTVQTSGISAITGKFYDKKDFPDDLEIKDENTASKINVASLSNKRSTTKPSNKKWSTYLVAPPEHNDGDIGVKYNKYMAGKPRDWFVKMLYTALRTSFSVLGEPLCDSVKVHGKTKILVSMDDAAGEPYYLHGPWLIYGFRHTVTRKNWYTKLFVSRLDWDASADKI